MIGSEQQVSFGVRAERTAARLDVMGPRLANRTSPDAAATLAEIRAQLQRLAELALRAEGLAPQQLPHLGAHALGDQLRVLAHDLSDAAEPELAEAVATLEAISRFL